MHHSPDVAKRAVALCSLLLLLFAGLAIAHARSVTLGWDPNTEDNLAGYRVYYGTESGVHPTVIDVGNTTQVTISTLSPGVTYYFVVTAYNAAGLESLPSEEIEYFHPEDPPPPPPSTPSISTFQRNIYGAVELIFEGNLGRTHHIWVSPDLNSWTLLTSIVNSQGTVQVTDPGAIGAQRRFYKVSVE